MDRTTERIRQQIEKHRDRLRYSNATVARLAKLNRSDVSRFLNGHVAPKLEFLESLAGAFGMTLGQLLTESSPAPHNGQQVFSKSECDFMLTLRTLSDADRSFVVAMAKRLQTRRGNRP